MAARPRPVSSSADEEIDTEVGRKELLDPFCKEDLNHEAALEQEISKCKLKISGN